MINGVRFKVCGLTSQVDAVLAAECGADYLGFIFYPKSPRYVSLETYRSMSAHLPLKPKVAVAVEPTAQEVARLKDAGFDCFQFHFPQETPRSCVEAWSAAVTPEKLWLAPRLPQRATIEPALFALANTFLLDTYRADSFGGSGQAGDWSAFARMKTEYARLNWILAGGLAPDNILAALAATGASTVDVNSGVESVPGIKSAEKLHRFCDALRTLPLRSRPPF